jgi:ribosomal protein S18 acetylase RimI-like enzyme
MLPDQKKTIIRQATLADAESIGNLHALSWLNTYRGILPDSYLDKDVINDRKSYWKEKLPTLTAKDFVLVAEVNKTIVGFGAVLDKRELGYEAFIDNLHVSPERKGQGIGGMLLEKIFHTLISSGKKSVYLWVLKGNNAAEKFYLSKNARIADTGTCVIGGATIGQTRFVWDNLPS